MAAFCRLRVHCGGKHRCRASLGCLPAVADRLRECVCCIFSGFNSCPVCSPGEPNNWMHGRSGEHYAEMKVLSGKLELGMRPAYLPRLAGAQMGRHSSIGLPRCPNQVLRTCSLLSTPCCAGKYHVNDFRGSAVQSFICQKDPIAPCHPGTHLDETGNACIVCAQGRYGSSAGLTSASCSGACESLEMCPPGTVGPLYQCIK